MKNIAIAFSLLIFSFTLTAQNNYSHTRISVITCGPGEDLYSLFGHTAIRVIDSTNHTDSVYNWGGFTFDQPYFYLKFARGQLLYYSIADQINSFMEEYVYEHRSVYEQVLNLDSASKQKIIAAIYHNMEGDNRFYKYDFLLDNCTTRVRNIIFENNKDAVISDKVVPDKTTARDLIHYYLERGSQPWTELGLDILMGGRIDRPLSNNEAMFMPEFLMKGLSQTKKQNTAFAGAATVLLQGSVPQDNSGKYIPLIVLTIVCIIVFIISRLKAAWAKRFMSLFDALMLYITGLLGLLLLFMWFGTDHTVCKNNFNLAWALPFNLPIAFFLIKKPRWLSSYFFIIAVITLLFLATWFWLPQQINIALLPVVILLLNRYVILANHYKRIS
jgi:hypothetical protein